MFRALCPFRNTRVLVSPALGGPMRHTELFRIVLCALSRLLPPSFAVATPRVIVISLDGAKPDLVELFLLTGALDRDTGIGRIASQGVRALQNVTATPSVTAVSHIAIATGSTAV